MRVNPITCLRQDIRAIGLQHMPVPELTAINMLGPVLVTLMAAWLLGEPVTWLRRAVLAAGRAVVPAALAGSPPVPARTPRAPRVHRPSGSGPGADPRGIGGTR